MHMTIVVLKSGPKAITRIMFRDLVPKKGWYIFTL